jgi:hypothetical protein
MNRCFNKRGKLDVSGKVESQYLVGSSSHPNRMLTLLGKAGIVGHSISSHSSGRGLVELFLSFVSFARVTAARSVGTDPHEVGGAKINILATE